jgi:excisionase family DNA binding protein
MVDDTPPELLTTAEVAKMLRVSRSRVKELVTVGVLHPIRLTPNGHFRYHRTEIQALIAPPLPSRQRTG